MLIGATTENPSFQVNSALLSRCRVIVLEKLSNTAIEKILYRAVDEMNVHIVDSVDDVKKEKNTERFIKFFIYYYDFENKMWFNLLSSVL